MLFFYIGSTILDKFFNNKLNIYIIKIDKSKTKLKKNLNQKYEHSLKIIDFFIKKTNINEDQLYDFLNVNLKKIELDQLNNILVEVDIIIQKQLDQNEQLINDKVFSELKKNTDELDVIINSTKKYYNKIVKDYNLSLKKFPTNIIGKIKKYEPNKKLKELEKEELKILKNY